MVTITPDAVAIGVDAVPDIAKVVISIKGEIASTDPTLAEADASSAEAAVRHTITLTDPVDTAGVPTVVSVQRLRPGSQTVVAAFQEVRIAG